jgi:hypothetical protein
MRTVAKIPRMHFLTLASALAFAAGCGGTNSIGRQAVSGTVTLDGKPLANAVIRFEGKKADTIVEAGASVVDGQYEIAAEKGIVPGLYRVFISSMRDTGETDMTMGKAMPKRTESLPARYNRQSTLSAEVKQGEAALFDFKLKSK